MKLGRNHSAHRIGAILHCAIAEQNLHLIQAKCIHRIQVLIGSVTENGIVQPNPINQHQRLIPLQTAQRRRAPTMVGFLYHHACLMHQPFGGRSCFTARSGTNFL